MTEEIEDVVAVYDEMLEYRKFLEQGMVLNVDVPEIKYEGAIWSGLRLADRAVVRAFTGGKQTIKTQISAFEGMKIQIECPPEGATYMLRLAGGTVEVSKAP